MVYSRFRIQYKQLQLLLNQIDAPGYHEFDTGSLQSKRLFQIHKSDRHKSSRGDQLVRQQHHRARGNLRLWWEWIPVQWWLLLSSSREVRINQWFNGEACKISKLLMFFKHLRSLLQQDSSVLPSQRKVNLPAPSSSDLRHLPPIYFDCCFNSLSLLYFIQRLEG